jgi:hypothetical protein
MMKRPAAAFKETQLFDWDAEPSLERSSTFFQDSAYAAMPAHRRRGRGGVLWLAFGLALGTGFVGLIELTPLLHRVLG